MSSVRDNWGRLVEAVLKREDLKQLALCESLSSSISIDSSVGSCSEDESDSTREIETGLMRAQQTIMSLHSNHSKIWDSNPLIVSEYLQAVFEVLRLSEHLGNMPLKRRSRSKELFDQTQSILQMAKQCLCEENLIYEESFVSNEDDSVGNPSQRESSSIEIEEYVVDLIRPDVVPQIKTIATIMFDSGYDQEFCQVFTAFGRDTLAEHLAILRVQKFSPEDVLQMEWRFLNSEIRKWRLAIKEVIQVYLASAKRLFDHVLGEYGCISSSCLVEASKGPLLSLLNFGQAVSIGTHKPEWLFSILNVYEALEALSPEVDALFPEGIGSSIKIEFHHLLTRLKDSAKAIYRELGNHIALCSSTTPFPNGGITPLTKYVMNYILCFAEYDDTLNLLLQDDENSDVGPLSLAGSATRLQSWTSILEANLEKRSDLYKDCSLKHIFMMNNIHYMVEKIRNSKLIPHFGDEWFNNHVAKFRQHAMCYERVTWSSILELLHDDKNAGKATLKARSRAFTAAFEDIYKNQTTWCVPDLQLREDLRISASKTVIQAYRTFFGRVIHRIGKKHFKYTDDDLETYILDLLEGSSKSLNHTRKKRMWMISRHSS